MSTRLKQILLILGVLLYLVSPVDLIPDLVPGLGWLDDLIVVGLLVWFLSGGGTPWRGVRGGAAEDKSQTTSADPYTILGVDRGASPDEIRAAHRRMVAQYHPDKVSHLGKEFQEMAHQKLIAIQQAYELLMARTKAKQG